MPKISVIVPVYNDEKYLDKCISSIANQTLKDIEILAINDGSTDKSLEKLEKLSSQYKNLYVFNKENGGAGSARNMGLDYANGEYIKFVDADDYLKLDILDTMYNIAKDNNVKLVRGNYKTIIGPLKTNDKCSWSGLEGNQIVDVHKNKDYIVSETPSVGNKLIHRDLIDNLRFPETKWEDLAVMPIVVVKSEKLYHMDSDIYNYRVNLNTTVKDFINKIPNILDIIICLDKIEDEMTKLGLNEEYKDQIESLYVIHTLYRVENVMHWVNFAKDKKKIIVSSLIGLMDVKYPNWKDNEIVNKYRNINSLFNFDIKRMDKYIDDNYRNVNIEEAKNNINKSFK